MATLQNKTALVTGASRGIGPRNSRGACQDSTLPDCLVNTALSEQVDSRLQ